MMEKYLKMSGHFVGKVSINTDGQICDDKYFRGSTDIAEDYYKPICHAINSHDELVAEVELLRNRVKNLKHLAAHFAECGGWDVDAYQEYVDADAE